MLGQPLLLLSAWATLLWTAFLSVTADGLAQAPSVTADVLAESPSVTADGQSKYMRFLDRGREEGTLQTSIVTFRNADGIEVALIGAVHIGDKSYYATLSKDFERYDSLLYEMIKDKDVDPTPDRKGGMSMLSAFQRMLKNMLSLEFQLDGIDYSHENFVHADMDPKTFFAMQKKKGESILTLMLNAMRHEFKKQREDRGRSMNTFDLLRAFMSDDSSRTLKYLFAKQLEDMEDALAGIESNGGSVIVAERNKVALRVLVKEVEKGRKKLGIFYGAAHMDDMEKRLTEEMGFEQVGEPRWINAWEIRRKGSKRGPRKPAPKRRRI